MKNLLTDISGVRVGHADDATLASGVTAIVFDQPAVASIDIRGGGPGTRDADRPGRCGPGRSVVLLGRGVSVQWVGRMRIFWVMVGAG